MILCDWKDKVDLILTPVRMIELAVPCEIVIGSELPDCVLKSNSTPERPNDFIILSYNKCSRRDIISGSSESIWLMISRSFLTNYL